MINDKYKFLKIFQTIIMYLAEQTTAWNDRRGQENRKTKQDQMTERCKKYIRSFLYRVINTRNVLKKCSEN